MSADQVKAFVGVILLAAVSYAAGLKDAVELNGEVSADNIWLREALRQYREEHDGCHDEQLGASGSGLLTAKDTRCEMCRNADAGLNLGREAK